MTAPIPADLDVVWTPAHPSTQTGEANVVFEIWSLTTGQSAALAFTSLEHLVIALGPAQPWVSLSLAYLRTVVAAGNIDTVAIDPALDPYARIWTLEDLLTLEKQMTAN